jgi:hypothetical protein
MHGVGGEVDHGRLMRCGPAGHDDAAQRADAVALREPALFVVCARVRVCVSAPAGLTRGRRCARWARTRRASARRVGLA